MNDVDLLTSICQKCLQNNYKYTSLAKILEVKTSLSNTGYCGYVKIIFDTDKDKENFKTAFENATEAVFGKPVSIISYYREEK